MTTSVPALTGKDRTDALRTFRDRYGIPKRQAATWVDNPDAAPDWARHLIAHLQWHHAIRVPDDLGFDSAAELLRRGIRHTTAGALADAVTAGLLSAGDAETIGKQTARFAVGQLAFRWRDGLDLPADVAADAFGARHHGSSDAMRGWHAPSGRGTPYDDAHQALQRVYDAAHWIEREEGRGNAHGNGHHAMQAVAAFAGALLDAHWPGPLPDGRSERASGWLTEWQRRTDDFALHGRPDIVARAAAVSELSTTDGLRRA